MDLTKKLNTYPLIDKNEILPVKYKRLLFSSGISLIAVILLIYEVNWQEIIRIFYKGVSLDSLILFAILAFAIAQIYGYRWNLLLDRQLQSNTPLTASILCLGGNMFLPARGGDLLRVYYTHVRTQMPHAKLLSRLFLEKVIDLITITAVGALAVILLNEFNANFHSSILSISVPTILSAVLFSVFFIRYFSDFVLRLVHSIFKFAGKAAFLEQHVENLLRDAGKNLRLRTMLFPALLTLFMWLSIYVPSYMLAARFVGINLSYQESMIVLFAGALGLMLPAAPSGVGTFHASVVSAFILLGRSYTEGLLVGTAIHFLFFIAYAVPAAILYAYWRFSHAAQI